MATVLATEFDTAALLARLSVTPRGITTDSRLVRPGDIFAAYRGQAADGRAFIPDAIARGADAVLWDGFGFRWNSAWDVSNAAVDDLKSKLGTIADVVYRHPSRSLWMVGVTGTNGKTSCAHWIAQCLDACGRRAGIIGTLGNGLVGALAPSVNTTPDAALVHQTLAEFRDAGAKAVAMEVSSHGLDQGRVNAVAFDVALFTNLTRDHLDYHGTMAAYGAAKAKLFAWPGLRAGVINADDAFGQSLAEAARGRRQKVLTYGLVNADIVATRVTVTTTRRLRCRSRRRGARATSQTQLSVRSMRPTCSACSAYCWRAGFDRTMRLRRFRALRHRPAGCSAWAAIRAAGRHRLCAFARRAGERC